MVDSIQPLTELEFPHEEKKPTAEGQRLYLRFPNREDPRLDKVKLVLSFFPGKQQAVLFFEDCRRKVGTWCQIHPALVSDLKERLGDENVVVK